MIFKQLKSYFKKFISIEKQKNIKNNIFIIYNTFNITNIITIVIKRQKPKKAKLANYSLIKAKIEKN